MLYSERLREWWRLYNWCVSGGKTVRAWWRCCWGESKAKSLQGSILEIPGKEAEDSEDEDDTVDAIEDADAGEDGADTDWRAAAKVVGL